MRRLAALGASLLALAAGGCASVEDHWHEAHAVAGEARAHEIAAYGKPAEPVPATLGFDALLERAVGKDMEVARLGTEVEQGRLQVDGARSLRLPRFSLRSSVDVPLDKGGYGDRQVNGGLVVDYDLVRAMFAGAETAVAQARVRQSQAEHERAVRELEWRLVRLLVKREQVRESGRIASDGTLVASLAEEGLTGIHGGGGEAWRWRSELESRRSAERVAGAEVERVSRELNRRLDLPEEAVVEVSDVADVLARLDLLTTQMPELAEAVQGAMEREERIEIAETRMFLAGMAVEKARRARWPSVSVGVGFGEFYLPARDETAHVVGQLQLSYPLWDAGDREREVQTAMLQKSRAESGVRETSAAVAAEVSGAWREWHQARDELDAAKIWLDTVDARIGMAAGDAGISGTAELRMLKLGAQSRMNDALFRARDATAALLQASGRTVAVLRGDKTEAPRDNRR